MTSTEGLSPVDVSANIPAEQPTFYSLFAGIRPAALT